MSPPSTRDKLILAMSRSMQTRGFEATGMKDVLESAAVSTGSMYHAFPRGKEELGAAAVSLLETSVPFSENDILVLCL